MDDARYVLNPTVRIDLTVHAQRPDGSECVTTVPLSGSELSATLVDAARLLDDEALALEVDEETIARLRSSHVLLTQQERRDLAWTNELTSHDFILATYPKSGTTWAQMLAYQVAIGGALQFRHINDFCPYIPDTAIFSDALSKNLRRLSWPRFLRTHLCRQLCPKHCRYILVLRDPRDVLVSYHHHLASIGSAPDEFDDFVDIFIKGRVPYGSWFDHLRSWWPLVVSQEALVLSYESMSEDLWHCASRLAAYVGIELRSERRSALLGACSFEAMKRQAALFDARGPRTGVDPKSFFRCGTTGDGRRRLSGDNLTLVNHHVRELVRDLDPDLSVAGMPAWWSELASPL